MTLCAETILVFFLLSVLLLPAASRLLHCIRIVAFQGVLLGLLPLVLWNWGEGFPHGELYLISAVNVAVKALLLPALLTVAMRRTKVKRELEPLVGYSGSVLIALALTIFSFLLAGNLPLPAGGGCPPAVPVAISAMLTGLFMVVARRKAITQVIGFLVFENGISIFGNALTVEYGLVVELGVLLDVFVLVFIMGITVFQINREFEHIDADKLHQLGDVGDNASNEVQK